VAFIIVFNNAAVHEKIAVHLAFGLVLIQLRTN